MELNKIESRRLRSAIQQGVLLDGEIPEFKKRDRDSIGPQLRKLLQVWEAMTEDARETVLDDLGHMLDAKVIRYGAFEDAIRERLELIAYRRQPMVPGLFEAVSALRQIWIDRGNQTGGNLHRDRDEGKPDHPMLVFIAQQALLHLPSIGDGATDPEQRLHNAVRRVESQLKEIRASIY